MRRRLVFILIALPAVAVLLVSLSMRATMAQATGPIRAYLPLVAGQVPTGSEVRLVAVADTYIDQDEPAANFGSSYLLLTGNDQPDTPALGALSSLIRFDIPMQGPATIAKATLRVDYRGFWDYPDQPRVITVLAATEPWDESTVTWETQPARLPGVYGSVSIPANEQFGYRDIDVTALVQQWYDASLPNDGLYLMGPQAAGSDASYRAFLSRESVDTDKPYPPELVITFQ